ncbi:DNA-binding domain-containing protein [Paucibacter sp. DJ1R-11]|uniref:HvfC/BufC N-terminal domain-containing protein n=1 Tax=Paucibacter sp. DJ1R-11 TaxID=2893556 RepID=UPI0021E42300|nr:DNA-binding domain-containing protein [Paucibacter sp. DJ1R-11]
MMVNTSPPLATLATLAAQQRALQAAVRGQAGAGHGLLREPGADQGLAVYQDAYQARLLAALRDNYLVLHRALGDEDFQALGLAYLHAHPPRTPSLRWWGDRLGDFMAGQLAGPPEGLPASPSSWGQVLPHAALVDLARMDWALRMAFDAADSPALGREALQALAPQDWPGLRLRLRPGVQLLNLDWAVAPAWRRLRAEEPVGEATLAAPDPLTHVCLIWRPALETRWRSLPPLEGRLLQALAAGRVFGDLCEQAALELGCEAAAAPAVVGLLQAWLADQLLLPLEEPSA